MKVSLYVKCQPKNGVQYFGKTISENVCSYSGSGVVWKDIHKKYNIKDVETMIVGEFDENDPMLVEYALGFSAANNIVESNEWANLMVENGLDGGPRNFGNKHAKGYKHTNEAKEKITNAGKRPCSDITKDKIGKANKGNFHSDETKKLISKRSGKPHTELEKMKISKAQKGRKAMKDLVGKRRWISKGEVDFKLEEGYTLGW